MKKLITLLLAFVMLFSLCACGGGTDTPKSGDTTPTAEPQVSDTTPTTTEPQVEDSTPAPEETTTPEIEELAIGETATTDKVAFTLTSVDFSERLGYGIGNYLLPIDEHENGCLSANDGKIFLCITFSVENVGKDKVDKIDYFNITIDYNDGYTFEAADKHFIRTDDTYYVSTKTTGLLGLEPLSAAQEYRGYFEVPMELMDNTEAPLNISVILASTAGDSGSAYLPDLGDVEFVYTIR